MNVTSDLSQFGTIQLDEAKELLDHVKEIDCSGKLELQFNTSSGNVFLVDEDYRVWMMNGKKIEEFFCCPVCCHEGFKDDMKHGEDNKECQEYLKSIDVV